MSTLARLTVLIALLLCVLIGTQAQSSSNQTPTSTGSITGRVTINGQPAPGVKVAAQPSFNFQRDSLAEATTDAEGRYQLTGLAAGNYIVLTLAPGFVPSETKAPRSPGQTVTITSSQAIAGIDFALVRGAIITGRVTDADGKPVIRERVNLLFIDVRGQRQLYGNPTLSPSMFTTDDRGVYRIYGLAAGSYLVSVGKTGEHIYSQTSSGVYYPRTFYPGVSDEAQAKAIDLKPGDEAARIDITLGRTIQAYSVFGRIVDSGTGQPLSKGQCGFAEAKSDHQGRGQIRFSSAVNAQGEFRQPGFLPGRYILMLMPLETDYYSEPVTVEIIDRDITNLEIKARRGASMSGVVTLDSKDDSAALAWVSQFRVVVSPVSPGLFIPSQSFPINSDGSFTVTGVPPGRAQIGILPINWGSDQLLRIERNGAAQPKPLEIAPGEQITGLRLVMADIRGRVRGRVEVTGGPLPDGARLRVLAHRVGDAYGARAEQVVEVGPHGNFALENLPPGQYEFTLRAWLTSDNNITLLPSAPSRTLTVTSRAETQVILTLDLNAKEEKR